MPGETMVVLCLNDFPVGVYATCDAADAAALADWRRREPLWEFHALTFGQAYNGRIGAYAKYRYHSHAFVVNAEAQL